MGASRIHTEMPEERRLEAGRRIAEARADVGMTQTELARKVGCWHSTISRYETGERLPSQRIMRRLAEALDKPIPYLRASDWGD